MRRAFSRFAVVLFLAATPAMAAAPVPPARPADAIAEQSRQIAAFDPRGAEAPVPPRRPSEAPLAQLAALNTPLPPTRPLELRPPEPPMPEPRPAALRQPDWEIILAVDDPRSLGAVRDNAKRLSALYGITVRVLASERNLGFSGINNLASQKTLKRDMVAPADTVERLGTSPARGLHDNNTAKSGRWAPIGLVDDEISKSPKKIAGPELKNGLVHCTDGAKSEGDAIFPNGDFTMAAHFVAGELRTGGDGKNVTPQIIRQRLEGARSIGNWPGVEVDPLRFASGKIRVAGDFHRGHGKAHGVATTSGEEKHVRS